jgi:hypothetical protein
MYVQVNMEKPCTERIRGLNLALARPLTVQVTNRRIGVIKWDEAYNQSTGQVCTDRCPVYILHMLIIVVKWETAPGRFESVGTLVLNYILTNVALTQKDQPFFPSTAQFPNTETILEGRKIWPCARRGPKARTTMLTRTRSNLLDLYLNLRRTSCFTLFIMIANYNCNCN